MDGVRFIVGPADQRYVASGAGVRVDHIRGYFGTGFYVSRRGVYSTCG